LWEAKDEVLDVWSAPRRLTGTGSPGLVLGEVQLTPFWILEPCSASR